MTGAVTQSFDSLVNGTSTTQTTNVQDKINGAQQSLAGDQQTFLKLLTAQLKNQDPLSPLDANQFTQQLVVMTGVQQQIMTNQLLQQIASNGSSVDPIGMIGKSVTATTPNSTLKAGKADWSYDLDGAAAAVKLEVVDDLGRTVWAKDMGAQGKGAQSLSWDGKNAAGKQLADGGVYSLKVTALDAAGADIASRISQTGVVSSVETQNGKTLINLNGVKVSLSDVTAVSTAPTA